MFDSLDLPHLYPAVGSFGCLHLKIIMKYGYLSKKNRIDPSYILPRVLENRCH